METIGKSPNRLWRESGTTLSFANWIQREKDKKNFLVNKKFENFSNAQDETNDVAWLNDTINESRIYLGIDIPKGKAKNNNSFVGLNKTIIMLSVLIIAGAIGYKIYNKRK
jgi:hypothetical protein